MIETPRLSHPPTPDWKALLAIGVGAIIFAALLGQIRFLGHDWAAYFARQDSGFVIQRPNPSYPPWVLNVILRPLTELPPYTGLAILNGLTLAALTVLTFRYARFRFPEQPAPAYAGVLLVILSPLPWATLWLGQVDVMLLLGLVSMPFGVPLLLGKLHTGVWAGLASRRDFLWCAAWGVLSILIWGFWPLPILTQTTDLVLSHPITMGWRALSPALALLGAILLLLTDRDPLRLIAAGSFISPYMMPYHYLVLLPALGKTYGWRQVLLWATSWIFVAVMGIATPETKWLSLSFPLLVWIFLAPRLALRPLLQDPDLLINRLWRTARQVLGGWQSIARR